MIPRLGDGNSAVIFINSNDCKSLENDSPSRGRKHPFFRVIITITTLLSLENDSPSRGRKRDEPVSNELPHHCVSLENDSPSRGRKRYTNNVDVVQCSGRLENDSPSRGRKRK